MASSCVRPEIVAVRDASSCQYTVSASSPRDPPRSVIVPSTPRTATTSPPMRVPGWAGPSSMATPAWSSPRNSCIGPYSEKSSPVRDEPFVGARSSGTHRGISWHPGRGGGELEVRLGGIGRPHPHLSAVAGGQDQARTAHHEDQHGCGHWQRPPRPAAVPRAGGGGQDDVAVPAGGRGGTAGRGVGQRREPEGGIEGAWRRRRGHRPCLGPQGAADPLGQLAIGQLGRQGHRFSSSRRSATARRARLRAVAGEHPSDLGDLRRRPCRRRSAGPAPWPARVPAGRWPPTSRRSRGRRPCAPRPRRSGGARSMRWRSCQVMARRTTAVRTNPGGL